MPFCAPRLVGLVVGLLFGATAGCFKDSPAGDSGESGGCEEGSQGCACYGNGTCDLGLECSMGVCVPEGCTPGEELCTCNDGLCLGELVCEEGTCKEPSGESGTAGTDETTDGMETGTTDVTDTMVTVSDTAEVSTTGPADCDMGDCAACQQCALNSVCADAWNACQSNQECTLLLQCIESCVNDPNPECENNCYAQYPGGFDQAANLQYCVVCTACKGSCDPGGMTCN